MNQLWKIKLKVVPVSRCVRTLDLAELALKAGVHDLRRLRLGYLGNLPVSQARFTIVGRNLWLWTSVPHIDPETAAIEGSSSEANLAGIEYEQFPTARTFGINLSLVH